MTADGAFRPRRLAVAVVAAAGLVAAAPLAGVARSRLQSALSARFGAAVYAVIAALVLGAAVFALRRARRDAWWRGGLVALAMAMAAVYVRATGNADPAVRAVEAFHFVEYGLITFLFYRVWRLSGDITALALPALAAFLAGVAEEAYQWFLPARVGELRDVWLNGVAIGCALFFSVGAAPPRTPWRVTARAAQPICRLLAVVVLALAAFVHVVHLGQRVELGAAQFDSRYGPAGLAARGAERAVQWRVAPPLTRPDRFSREDQYMTEGLQHVQARNSALSAGDAVTAWHENAILEAAFAPVLDTPSYLAAAGHRWTPDQRAEVEGRAGTGRAGPFVSRAFPYPIYHWPPLALWAGAALLAAALVAAGARA